MALIPSLMVGNKFLNQIIVLALSLNPLVASLQELALTFQEKLVVDSTCV